jgi:hypothetical protein
MQAHVQLMSVEAVEAEAHDAMGDLDAAVPVPLTASTAEGPVTGPVAHPGLARRWSRGTKRRLREDQAVEAGTASSGMGGIQLRKDAAGNGAGPSLKRSRRQKTAISTAEDATVPLNLIVTEGPSAVCATGPKAVPAGEDGGLMGEPNQTAARGPPSTSPGVHGHPQQHLDGVHPAVPEIAPMTSDQDVNALASNAAYVVGTAARPNLGGRISTVVPGLKVWPW